MISRNMTVAFAVSLVVCFASMYVNYRAYQERHYLEWSYRSHGGEIKIEFAPGWHSVHIYAMHPDEHDSHKLVFSPVLLAVALFVFTLVGWAALAKLSAGDPIRDFFMLLVGYAVLFYGGRILAELWEDYFG